MYVVCCIRNFSLQTMRICLLDSKTKYWKLFSLMPFWLIYKTATKYTRSRTFSTKHIINFIHFVLLFNILVYQTLFCKQIKQIKQIH